LSSLSTWNHRIVRPRRAQTIPRSTPALRVAFDGCSRFRLASMQLSAQSAGVRNSDHPCDGQRKFAYDLWGDTVNLASRLESHGQPGRVLVSESVVALLRNGSHKRQRLPCVASSCRSERMVSISAPSFPSTGPRLLLARRRRTSRI
jgi:hypothetical protein